MSIEIAPAQSDDYQPVPQDAEYLLNSVLLSANRFFELYRQKEIPRAASFHGDLVIGSRKRPGNYCVTISRIENLSTHILIGRSFDDEEDTIAMELTDTGLFKVEDTSYNLDGDSDDTDRINTAVSYVTDPDFKNFADLREFGWLLVQANMRTNTFGS